ncbi:FAD-linked oxidoreductase, partial [Dendrothele bispora CBS 962.96]
YLLATRPESNNSEPVVSYPGCAHQSDLDVLFTKPTSSSSSSSDSNSNSKSKSRPHLTLTHSDILLLRDLHTDLRRICLKAEKRGVKVVIDAEYSWFQPAMDAFQIALMREFNRSSESLDSTSNGDSGEGEEMRGRVQPLVYGTYQAYLRRTLTQLTHDLADSREHGYALGVKLVRGAYHPYEIKAHQKRHKAIQPQEGLSSSSKDSDEKSSSLSLSNETLPPVWQTKKETDECFDDCVRMLIGRVAEDVQQSQNQNQNQATVQGKSSPTTPATATRIGVLFGTHNWTSSKLVLGELVRLGLVSGVHHHGTTRSTSNDNDNGSSKRIVIDVDDNRNRYQDKYGSTTNEDSDEDNRVLTIPASVADRVCMGHLYGMNDVLSDYIVKRTKSEEGVPPVPMVVKYIPYGALSQVMPYLGRRAIENQSVLGNENAAEERRRAGREIWRRVFGR